jgi:hypothetical protein
MKPGISTSPGFALFGDGRLKASVMENPWWNSTTNTEKKIAII